MGSGSQRPGAASCAARQWIARVLPWSACKQQRERRLGPISDRPRRLAGPAGRRGVRACVRPDKYAGNTQLLAQVTCRSRAHDLAVAGRARRRRRPAIHVRRRPPEIRPIQEITPHASFVASSSMPCARATTTPIDQAIITLQSETKTRRDEARRHLLSASQARTMPGCRSSCLLQS